MKKKRSFNGAAGAWWASLFWALLLSIHGDAQNSRADAQNSRPDAQNSFSYQSSLDTVAQAAFYRIRLNPELIAKCKKDLADLRISDQDGNFIPYVLKSDQPVLSTDGFREFPILSNQQIKDSCTEVVIENQASSPLDYLLLVMKNSSAHRSAILSGSDDRLKWYAIREHIELEEAGSDTADHYVQSVTFPSSSYHFFKINLNDKGLLPLHMLKAGIYTRSFTIGRYQDVPDPVIRQKDSSDKHSYITLSYKEPYRIDKLDLDIKGPALYRRYARIYANDTAGGLLVTGGGLLVTGLALDPLNTSFRIPPVKTSRLLIDISNEDNAPLLIQRATSSQLDQYLMAYLQPGHSYRLLAGNDKATAPEYDLKYFVDTVSMGLHEIRPGILRSVESPKRPAARAGKDYAGVILWSIIGAVLLLLILLSVKMVKSIPEKHG
jgi:hypothetical protein